MNESNDSTLTTPGIIAYWLPVVAYLFLIFYLSSLPHLGNPLPFSASDKLIHFVEYGILSWLLSRAFISASPFSEHARILAIIFAILYAISDEFHQSFVPGRSPEVLDVIADTLGAVLVQVIAYMWMTRKKLADM